MLSLIAQINKHSSVYVKIITFLLYYLKYIITILVILVNLCNQRHVVCVCPDSRVYNDSMRKCVKFRLLEFCKHRDRERSSVRCCYCTHTRVRKTDNASLLRDSTSQLISVGPVSYTHLFYNKMKLQHSYSQRCV